jgi:hypothetical protein
VAAAIRGSRATPASIREADGRACGCSPPWAASPRRSCSRFSSLREGRAPWSSRPEALRDVNIDATTAEPRTLGWNADGSAASQEKAKKSDGGGRATVIRRRPGIAVANGHAGRIGSGRRGPGRGALQGEARRCARGRGGGLGNPTATATSARLPCFPCSTARRTGTERGAGQSAEAERGALLTGSSVRGRRAGASSRNVSSSLSRRNRRPIGGVSRRSRRASPRGPRRRARRTRRMRSETRTMRPTKKRESRPSPRRGPRPPCRRLRRRPPSAPAPRAGAGAGSTCPGTSRPACRRKCPRAPTRAASPSPRVPPRKPEPLDAGRSRARPLTGLEARAEAELSLTALAARLGGSICAAPASGGERLLVIDAPVGRYAELRAGLAARAQMPVHADASSGRGIRHRARDRPPE